MRKEIAYLGHLISDEGVRPNPNKIKTIEQYPTPKNQKHIKQFLGLIGYYRKFIKDFSSLTKPLTQLLKKDVVFKWENRQQINFEKLKQMLIHTHTRTYFTIP